jgi:hypothetical protein
VAYATVAQLRDYLPQVENTAGNDTLLGRILDRATQIIDTELGFAFGTATVSMRTVYGDGTDYLIPPVFVSGSVTAVTTITGYSVPSYIEQDGALVARTSAGVLAPLYSYPLLSGDVAVGAWLYGVPYTVAATFGYASVPADIVEATLEIAVRIWRARDAGFSDVVGVEGSGAVGYNGKYPAVVTAILDNYKARVPRGVGVW